MFVLIGNALSRQFDASTSLCNLYVTINPHYTGPDRDRVPETTGVACDDAGGAIELCMYMNAYMHAHSHAFVHVAMLRRVHPVDPHTRPKQQSEVLAVHIHVT